MPGCSSAVTIDEQALDQIAQLTGGRYFRATDAAALGAIYAEIDRLAKAKPGFAPATLRRALPFVLALALALLVFEIVMVNTRLRTVP